jgi:hypothetical protein
MSLPTDSSNLAGLSLEETGQTHPFSTQHSRNSSVQSTSTDCDCATEQKASKFPDMVRLDMELFMARLARTNSNDSTTST